MTYAHFLSYPVIYPTIILSTPSSLCIKNHYMKQAFKQHWKLYLMEALGLAIFMVSACFFAGFFESPASFANKALTGDTRHILNGILMGATALFIFYSPFTSPSGAHINPAVTITFLRFGKISKNDA